LFSSFQREPLGEKAKGIWFANPGNSDPWRKTLSGGEGGIKITTWGTIGTEREYTYWIFSSLSPFGLG